MDEHERTLSSSQHILFLVHNEGSIATWYALRLAFTHANLPPIVDIRYTTNMSQETKQKFTFVSYNHPADVKSPDIQKLVRSSVTKEQHRKDKAEKESAQSTRTSSQEISISRGRKSGKESRNSAPYCRASLSESFPSPRAQLGDGFGTSNAPLEPSMVVSTVFCAR